MLKILCINGAPGVGKDTAGRLLKEIYGNDQVWIRKFAEPLNHIAGYLLNMNPKQFSEVRETHKEQSLKAYGCQLTLRQLLISISEDLIKPTMGQTWFAEKLTSRILDVVMLYPLLELIVITDCGFQYEYDQFKETMRHHAHVRLINMTRVGHTFNGDSRSEVKDDDAIYINNDGSLEDLKSLLSVEFF